MRVLRAGFWVVLAVLLTVAACARRQLAAPVPAVAGYAAVARTLIAERQTQRVGPVPEFAPVHAILTHEEAVTLAPQLNPLLARLLGQRHHVAHHQWPTTDPEPGEMDKLDDSVVWMRDYQPIFVREPDGGMSALYYLSYNANRTAHRLDPRFSPVRTRTLPLLHENGNLVSNGRYVFFAETLFEENREAHDEPHLREGGYRPRSEEEILAMLASAFHRAPSELIALPALPYESTGHIDLYVLPLDEHTVVIPSIEEDGLALTDRGVRAFHVAKVLQQFLDEQAAYLASLDLEVVRLPMIPPAIEKPADASGEEDDIELLVFSPANSLLVNLGAGGRLVIVPSFPEMSDDVRTVSLLARYEKRWEAVFRRHGWEPHFVDSSELVGYLGLIRCVSATIPAEQPIR